MTNRGFLRIVVPDARSRVASNLDIEAGTSREWWKSSTYSSVNMWNDSCRGYALMFPLLLALGCRKQ